MILFDATKAIIIFFVGDYHEEIRHHIQLRKTDMNHFTRILSDRDIPLETKKLLVQTVVFPVFLYETET